METRMLMNADPRRGEGGVSQQCTEGEVRDCRPAPLRRCAALVWLAGLLATSGCRSVLPVAYQVEPTPSVVGCRASGCANAEEQVEITYLGVSGFLVKYRGAVLLTAPFFSNPSLKRVAQERSLRFDRRDAGIRADTALIRRLLPADAAAASMILVGHSHYDHLMDVPFIAREISHRAAIIGSPTMRHILMGDRVLAKDSGRRLIAVRDSAVADSAREGHWIYSADSAFRVKAIASDHAPNLRLLGIPWTIARGTERRDLKELPKYADEWKLGETLSFVIDVLDRGSPRLRLYYQSAASTPPLGFPSLALLAQRNVDVALLAAAASQNVRNGGAPGRLLEHIRPAYVLVGHWESFFTRQTLPIRVGEAMDADAFLDALGRSLPSTAGWQMPLPRTTVRFDLRP